MTWLADFLGARTLRLVGAVLVVVLVAVAGWRVATWRAGYLALEATEKRLQAASVEAEQCAAREQIAAEAYAEAAGKAVDAMRRDRETAQRVERELQDKLAAADGRARDLARRLLEHARAAGAGRGALSGAAVAASQPAAAGGESGSDGGIEQATAEVMRACAADATRLDGWRAWWAEVSAGR